MTSWHEEAKATGESSRIRVASTLAYGELPHLELWLRISGGCQFHPMPYHLQLAHKKRTVKLAYERFSKLPAELVPEIQDTIPSPKQWGYRTKITPHFDAAPNRIKKAIQSKKSLGLAQASEESDLNSDLKNGTDGKWWMPDDEKREINWNLRIGFDKKAGSGVLDIEVSHSL